MRANSRKYVGVFLLAAVVVCLTSGCVEAAKVTPAEAYLASVQSSHHVDSHAEEVCTKDQVSPFSSKTPINDPIVAVNSTLAMVRKLELPGYAKRMGDTELTGASQGYAAICLFKTTDNGAPKEVWTFALPNGDQGFINAG